MQEKLFEFPGPDSKRNRDRKSFVQSAEYGNRVNIGPFRIDGVYLSDCADAMKLLPSHSFDVAIVDPPYNLSKGGTWKWDNSVELPGFGGDWSKVKAAWDDMPLADYFSFTLAWLAELKRLVRPSGSFWIHGTYHNIGIINFAMQILGIEIINEIAWYKRNSFPNLSGRRLTASHETILWAHTGGAKNRRYYFAYEKAKNMACPEDFLKEQGKQMRTVWDIPNNKKPEETSFGKHPTQKPVRLLMRMLELSARPGNVLLVPFAGSGSDCIAATKLGLHFLAFENDPHYVGICLKRLESLKSQYLIPLEGKAKNEHQNEVLNNARSAKEVPSLIKWTGSKRSQANVIAKLMPRYRRYFEPFLGGGALLYLAAVPGSVAGDLYEPLIKLWQLLQAAPEEVLEDYEHKWRILRKELDNINISKVIPGSGLPKFYYEIRDRFNRFKNPLNLNFLMRTCVNGIARFNEKGEFNNSFHLSRRGMTPLRFKNVVETWKPVIKGVKFICQDYSKTLQMAQDGDFAYLDPPYFGNRQRYIENLDLPKLLAILEDLNRRGVKWALSFDGRRGEKDLSQAVPRSLFKRHLMLASGNSAVNKVLNGPIERVEESLYLNY